MRFGMAALLAAAVLTAGCNRPADGTSATGAGAPPAATEGPGADTTRPGGSAPAPVSSN